MSIPHIIQSQTITFYVGGQPYAIDRDSSVADGVIAELRKANPDPDTLVELADVARSLSGKLAQAEEVEEAVTRNYLNKGIISVSRSGVTFDGKVIDNALARRLVDILNLGLRIGPFIRFAENVYMNPAEYAREELMEWLETSDLPITEDGCFLAYKKVRSDFKDIHSGTMDNSPGQVVQLKGRQSVNPDRNQTCSYGLHFCSKDYLPQFASSHGNRVVIVKVNPADVVSIPADYNHTKGRTWRYEVMEEIDYAEVADKAWDPISYDYDDYDDDEYDDFDYDEYEDEDLEDNEPLVADSVNIVAEIERLKDEYSIVDLRRMASRKGLNSQLAWKQYSKDQLADYVARN